MNFEVAAESYDRFMGRYAATLAPELADFAGVAPGQKVLDVGCGPGALTAVLVDRLGAGSVAAVDPSESFVDAARSRHPDVDVQRAAAESLPYQGGTFDAAIAQLVVHFMTDPVAGLREMARVTRPDGVVAACVWDFAGERSPLSVFWQAVAELDPGVENESGLAGAREGHLVELLDAAGVRQVEETTLAAANEYSSFDEWWEPFTLRVGPAGAYAHGLTEPARAKLRARCRELLPPAPFTISSFAWAARGVV